MADPKTPKPWGGRFQKAADPALERFSSSVHFDQELWREDIRGSIAHATMLAQQGILAREDTRTLVGGLEQIARELDRGEFVLDPALEDVHMNIERRLYAIVGDVAGRLHTGRSRNDQIATDFALWLRERVPALRAALLELRRVLVERAEREADVLLPGYTHLQRAQPVRLAHHWLAYFEMLTRDDGRLRDARTRLDASPLGSGALAGSTLPLDRESTALALGFDRPSANSLDAIASRDGALELLSASSTEFGFVEMDDAFATGSSLMPQKKNTDVAELVRGKSGRAIGDLMSLLVTMKGLPLSYNRDMQEDKEPVFDAVQTASDSLEVLAGAIASLRVNRAAMGAAASDPMLLATDLAEHLVGAQVPFREAHEVVGRVVAHAIETNTPLSALSRERLQEFHPSLDIDPATFFSAERSVEARSAIGGPARKTVDGALRDAHNTLDACARELAS